MRVPFSREKGDLDRLSREDFLAKNLKTFFV